LGGANVPPFYVKAHTMKNRIIIFDTTLRDGEQSPGASLNIQEKVKIAQQLAKLKVDVIEAGFPMASEGDFQAVKTVAQKVAGPTIAALARATSQDIDRAWEAVKHAQRPRIHTFIATSDIHLKYKLKRSKAEVLEAAVAAVKRAKAYTTDVEFSAEDATRSEHDFLCQVVEAVIEAGATTVNIPDTVGYAIPAEFYSLIEELFQRVPNIDKAVISVHCHNDLGLAVSNSLAAATAGARQIECTINGLGERAGNASLEEVVMAINTRRDFFGLDVGVNTRQIYKTSKMVANLTGMQVQRNKAIVGENAFAHEAGIHQDGFLKEKTTYEIMTPESIGLAQSQLVLGKHSGRHAFRDRLQNLGYTLNEEQLNKAFTLFKNLADKKKNIFDEDLMALIDDEVLIIPQHFTLEYLHISSGTDEVPKAEVKLRHQNEVLQDTASGDGQVDAVFKTIDRLTRIPGKLLDYSVRSITMGKDAVGEVRVKVGLRDGGTCLARAPLPILSRPVPRLTCTPSIDTYTSGRRGSGRPPSNTCPQGIESSWKNGK
jgi:2-isopropylmalate synthase